MKAHHADDLTLQAFVLASTGIAVSSIELLHVDTSYVRGSNGVCWAGFFGRSDAGDATATALADLPERLPAMREYLIMAAPPAAESGKQCATPYGCEFWDRCTADKSVDWISHLPRLSRGQTDELETPGIDAISAIPVDFPLTPKQAIIRNVTASGPPYVVPDVALAVPLEQAETYGDMLTVETGHLQHWSRLARRGAPALRAAGLPTAPVWSEYEE